LAGGIVRRDVAGIVSSELDKDEKISYCPKCESNGLKKIMQQRIYKPDEPSSDSHLWRQCHYCGTIEPVYGLKIESELSDIVQIENNPHKIGENKVIGLMNKRYKKNNIQKQRERQKKELDSIEDEDERRDRRRVGFIVDESEF